MARLRFGTKRAYKALMIYLLTLCFFFSIARNLLLPLPMQFFRFLQVRHFEQHLLFQFPNKRPLSPVDIFQILETMRRSGTTATEQRTRSSAAKQVQ